MRLLIAFCVGIAATLAWQSYGGAARKMISRSYPQLGWLAPRSAAQTTPATTMPPVTSSNPEESETISLSLAEMRQRVDELAANEDQIIREIATKLEVAKQEILDKVSALSQQVATEPRPTPDLPARHIAPVR
jgi:hypothetical protein